MKVGAEAVEDMRAVDRHRRADHQEEDVRAACSLVRICSTFGHLGMLHHEHQGDTWTRAMVNTTFAVLFASLGMKTP